MELTHKQRAICQMIAKGLLTKQVAQRMNMTEQNIGYVLRKIRLQCNCVNTTHLIAFLIEEKQITINENIVPLS